jgi:transposase
MNTMTLLGIDIGKQCVKPFVKGNLNGFIDAEAICEAASHPAMRFGSMNTAEQQTLSALHRVSESLIGHRAFATN